jgi:hypothetical protein
MDAVEGVCRVNCRDVQPGCMSIPDVVVVLMLFKMFQSGLANDGRHVGRPWLISSPLRLVHDDIQNMVSALVFIQSALILLNCPIAVYALTKQATNPSRTLTYSYPRHDDSADFHPAVHTIDLELHLPTCDSWWTICQFE